MCPKKTWEFSDDFKIVLDLRDFFCKSKSGRKKQKTVE